MGIYNRKQESKKTRKHAFDQESDQEKRKKERKHVLDQENKIQEKKIMSEKKKEGNEKRKLKLNILPHVLDLVFF